MSLERKLISFDGGMRDVPDTKPLNCPDKIVNYEQLQKGILEKRREPITFETSFDSAVRQTFNVEGIPPGNIIEYAPEPFYPANLPSDIAEGYDYLIPVYGYTGTDYKLYLFYKNDLGYWVHKTPDGDDLLKGIYDDGVVFTSDSKLRFSYDKNLLYIVDDVNNLFFITTDNNGNVVSAKCGIPAPKSIPIITAMDGWEDKYFEEDNIGDSLGDIGLVRVLYSCATKEGYKSNPSPASEFTDFQWIKLDAGSQDRWLKKFQVTNVKVPDGINDYIKDELKYFDFYFEIFLYSEGLDTKNFEFSCRRDIFDKNDANSYTIAIPASPAILADWENDIAPVAKDLVAFDGKVVLAQVKDKLKFPFEFDNIWRIKLLNPNNFTSVDGPVRIRLYDKDATPDHDNGIYPIENFNVSYYCNDTNILHTSEIRIYDTDLTTPIMVDYISGMSKTTGDNQYIDLFIAIPQLQANQSHTLYLCFDGEGVSTEYNTLAYGKFYSSLIDLWSDQKVFKPRKVTDENCLICSPMDEKDWAEDEVVPNKANKYTDGDNYATALMQWSTNKIAILGITSSGDLNDWNRRLGESCLFIKAGQESSVVWKMDGTEDYPEESIPEKFYMHGFLGAYTQFDENDVFFGIYDNNYDKFVRLSADSNHKLIVQVNWDGVSGNTLDFDTGITLPGGTHYKIFFMGLSVNFDSMKVFVKYRYFYYDSISGNYSLIDTSIAEIDISTAEKVEASKSIVVMSGMTGNHIQKCDQFVYKKNDYLNNDDTWKNIANFMPAFDNMIGYKYSDNSHNNNITFEKVDNSLKAKNILRWSKKGGFAFPDTYYKSGIPSPIVRIVRSLSTLALQSQNIIKIYLRNGLYKFIASGDPSTWANLSNNLIQQNPRLGLLQSDALAITPFGEFHLSETGIVQWLGDTLKIVTNIRDESGEYPIINIPLDKVYIMFYCPLRNQLFIQEKYEEKFLVTETGKYIVTEDGKKIALQL